LKRYELVSMLSVAACLLLVLAVTVGPLSGVLGGGMSASDIGAAGEMPAAAADSESVDGSYDMASSESITDEMAAADLNTDTVDEDYYNLFSAIQANIATYAQASAASADDSDAGGAEAAPAPIPSAAPAPEQMAVLPAEPFSSDGAEEPRDEDWTPEPAPAQVLAELGVDFEDLDTGIYKEDILKVYAADDRLVLISEQPGIVDPAGSGSSGSDSATGLSGTANSTGRSDTANSNGRSDTANSTGRSDTVPATTSASGVLARTQADYGRILYPGALERTDTTVSVYDIADKEAPVRLERLTQSGRYLDSAVIGDQLYLLSSYDEFDPDAIDWQNPQSFVPGFASGPVQEYAWPDQIQILPEISELAYTVVSDIDIESGAFTDHDSIFGGTPSIHADQDNLYLDFQNIGRLVY
jgi:hypothetical protein